MGSVTEKMNSLDFAFQKEVILASMTDEIVNSSKIEGELLNFQEVRSAVARKFDISSVPQTESSHYIDGIVEMMMDARCNHDTELTLERLCGWQAALFPGAFNGMYHIKIGGLRDDKFGPMQVVSSVHDNYKVHFQAPAAERLPSLMNEFLKWIARSTGNPLIRAAQAHLWFVTIHPFEDGNGRVARAITELMLARADKSPLRFYSLSRQIFRNREEYYLMLERAEKGDLDITAWLLWFLDTLCESLQESLKLVDKTNDSTGNQSMGKLSDLIKWNFEYPISKFERLRNEVLSGERSVKGSDYNFNRNPFIDDRTLPCRIWGDTNSETQRLCKMYLNKKAPTHIYLNETEINMAAMEEFTLKVDSVSPADAYDAVTWSSENENIATVSDGGLVRAINDGETIITATSVADTNIKATCKVIVETSERPLEAINVTPSLTLNVGSTGEIKVTNNPENAYPRPTYTFTSDNTDIATVSSNGVVRGLSVGKAEITVVAKQNDITKYGYCQIDVSQANSFKKITSAPSSWTGRYLIVNEDSKKAFNSGASDIDSKDNAIDVTISNGSITVTDQLMSALVEIVQKGSDYYLKTSTGLVIRSNGKNIKAEENGTVASTFTYSSGNVIITSGSQDYKLLFNKSDVRFRFYNTNQQPVTLYKLS